MNKNMSRPESNTVSDVDGSHREHSTEVIYKNWDQKLGIIDGHLHCPMVLFVRQITRENVKLCSSLDCR